jgi:hypothetical protein
VAYRVCYFRHLSVYVSFKLAFLLKVEKNKFTKLQNTLLIAMYSVFKRNASNEIKMTVSITLYTFILFFQNGVVASYQLDIKTKEVFSLFLYLINLIIDSIPHFQERLP